MEVKLIDFDTIGKIYRTNAYSAEKGTSMNNIYTQPKGTFFVTDPVKLNSYFAHVGQKGKEFSRKADADKVILFDMNDLNTVRWIKSHFPEGSPKRTALNRAFPEKDGKIKRFSSPETKELDVLALDAIRDTGLLFGMDGYYSPEQSGNYDFHAEIGLIPEAFDSFVVSNIVRPTAAPNVGGKKRKPDAAAGGGGGGKILQFNGGKRKTRRRKQNVAFGKN